ncbi:hypothetical protein JZO70_16660 [Enterococcus sp. 669A]|uniref:ScoMcrA-like SRA domain-containing protein n=1 Tax=Candidatus Enterococcus moelleringii TaxID=2815325 RepID=A0ABS3LDU3_9ENTE|nr:hypothetical protein [Enterococcus sp. 669A]MBO1307808.1 hypothetical protein [Enterococcus sp. 669A]
MIKEGQLFRNRKEISQLLGGDTQKGIANTQKAVLLFVNDNEIYSDYFYQEGSTEYLMYTGIGRIGDQDSLENNMYNLNLAVLSHQKDGKDLLVFEKGNFEKGFRYLFHGKYRLLETRQNFQLDDLNNLRRVFIFHLKKIT